MALALSFSVPVLAQNVAWQAPKGLQGDGDVSNLGASVDGIQCYVGSNVQNSHQPATDLTIGDEIFHTIRGSGKDYGDGTISFSSGTQAQFFNGNLRSPPDIASRYNALPIGDGVSDNYSRLVSNGAYFKAGPVSIISFGKLTPGHYYQVQLWGFVQNDWRNVVHFSDDLGNIGSLDAGAHLPKTGPLDPGQSYGETITGLFQASGAEASIIWAAGEGTPYPALSAVALRDVTAVPDVAETVAAAASPLPVKARDDLPGFAGMDVWKNLSYAHVGRHSLALDLFIPQQAKRPVPLVVYIHGGAWGGLDRTEGFANELLQHGFALACVDYRLTNEAVFPAQVQDCKAAVRWLRAHAAEYGYGADKIGAIGDSAGGHLVAMLGVTPDDPDLEGDEGNPGVSSRVQAVADYFGPTDLIALGASATTGPIPQLLGGPVDQNKEKARQASPLFLVTAAACPFVIVHGDSDKLVPIQQSIDFYNALQKAGVPSQFYTMPNAGHGANNPQAFDLVVSFFDKYLR